MKIFLLCDRKGDGPENPIRGALMDLLTQAGHDVESVTLSRQEVMPCTSCFGCWFKTPGRCVITKDGANSVAMKQVQADAFVLLSQVTYGGFSADIKAFIDRSIQVIMPFFEIYKGEMRHVMRYERLPIWVAVGYGDVCDEEKQTFIRLADRNALNFRSQKHLALTVRDSGELIQEGQSILKTLEVGS